MKKSFLTTYFPAAVTLLVSLFLTAGLSFAVNLAAVESLWVPQNGEPAIRMWGFIEDPGGCPIIPPDWKPGPVQTGTVNDTLSINLRNCLNEPISLIIPGLVTTLTPQTFVDARGRTRVRAFTTEVPADNGATTVSYTWNNLSSGTYLYQSGSHPAKQVPMGLYGAVTISHHPSAIYEEVLLFSEIDPLQHIAALPTTPLNYSPRYFLINGQTAIPGAPPPVIPNKRPGKIVQLRFLNAGLMTRVPTLQGPYMEIFAEDGNTAPYPKYQYSVKLPAGKTIDALWEPDTSRTYTLYDRRLGLSTNGAVGGGMIQQFAVRKFPWILFIPPMIPPPF